MTLKVETSSPREMYAKARKLHSRWSNPGENRSKSISKCRIKSRTRSLKGH